MAQHRLQPALHMHRRRPSPTRRGALTRSLPTLFALLLLGVTATVPAWSDGPQLVVQDSRTVRHQDPDWQRVAPHLPDMNTAPIDKLIMAGDVLRARRFPEDALDFYRGALARGGDQAMLLNRIGVTELELQHITVAQITFKRVVKLKPKIADGWNNLGATEYLQRDYPKAIKDYRKAAHLDDGRASYRSNLGTAYFEVKNYKKAREQFEAALELDPDVFTREGTSGVTAHIMAPEDRARFYFEMAKMSRERHDEAGMLHWLKKASDTGMDVRTAMLEEPDLAAFAEDARITEIVQNSRLNGPKETASVVHVTRLPLTTPAGAVAK